MSADLNSGWVRYPGCKAHWFDHDAVDCRCNRAVRLIPPLYLEDSPRKDRETDWSDKCLRCLRTLEQQP